jgi:hypothetical protein
MSKFVVGDIIEYQGWTGTIVSEDEEAYFIRWFERGYENINLSYFKAYHSRSFTKVS